MAFSAKIERDSISPSGSRLTTFVITSARITLAEVKTHRTLSQETECEFSEKTLLHELSMNSASSRAIPVAKMIEAVLRDPYIPDKFSKAARGMQGGGWLEGAEHEAARAAWLNARSVCVDEAQRMLNAGCHKQDANRLLEPWGWVTQVVTGTKEAFANFFALRTHAAAHPAFQKIARMMYLAYRKSTPREIDYAQWHLPFVSLEEQDTLRWVPPIFSIGLAQEYPKEIPDLLKFSAARCAWTSYQAPGEDGSKAPNRERLLEVFEKLCGSRPVHASPSESQATPFVANEEVAFPNMRSNLRGWIQLRKLLPMERVDHFEASEEEIAHWGPIEGV